MEKGERGKLVGHWSLVADPCPRAPYWPTYCSSHACGFHIYCIYCGAEFRLADRLRQGELTWKASRFKAMTC